MSRWSGAWAAFSQPGKPRELAGAGARIVTLFAIAIALYHIYLFSFGSFTIDARLHRILHLGPILALCFVTFSPSTKQAGRLVILDLILAVLCLVITGYLALNFSLLYDDRMSLDPGSLNQLEIAMGVFLMALLLEASRRAMGNWLGALVVLFLTYAYAGSHMTGVLEHSGFSFTEIIDFTVFTFDGIFTVPLAVASSYIIMFLIFGAFVVESGANRFFTELAQALVGSAAGGSGKIALISSALVGSITGNATANVAITGTVTIPMMKRAGFESHVAGGIEAAASKGGHILPPVMAGIVFLMSEISGISYWQICLASAIPASLYFLSAGFQVHFYATRHGIGGESDAATERKSAWRLLAQGWQHLLPFISIIAFLATGYSPIWAALWSLPVVVLSSWFHKETRMGIGHIGRALERSVMTVRVVTLAVALAGIIISVLFYTGLGSTLTSVLRDLAGTSLFAALLLAGFFCLLLGLSCTVIAAYILTAVLIVPTVMTLGIPAMAAHLFTVYLASVATITPPVGSTFFVAAGLADAPPFRTGWAALRMASAAFVVPFFFVYHPELLLIGNWTGTLLAGLLAVTMVFSLALAIEGWFRGPLDIWKRGLLGAAGLLMVSNATIHLVLGLGLFVLGLIWHLMGVKRPGE